MPSRPDPELSRRLALEEFISRTRLAGRRARLDAAAVEAIDALGQADVKALLLKGPALAAELYADQEERGYFDVDLLVRSADLAAAGSVLAGLGYRDVSRDRGVQDVAGVLHAQVWARLDDEIGNLMIDLHWKLDGCGASPDDAWQLLVDSPGVVTVAGCDVATLGRAGLAVHTALHLAQHGVQDAKAVADLRRALVRWPSPLWHEAARLAGQLRAEEAFVAGLRLLPEGAALADTLGLGSGETVLWDLAHQRTRPRGTFHLDAYSQARNARERVQVLRWALLPSPRWIRWEISWSRRSPAHLIAAYLTHLVRAPAWALRAVQFRRSRPR